MGYYKERIHELEQVNDELRAELTDMADELRAVRANYEGWRHEAKQRGAKGLEDAEVEE